MHNAAQQLRATLQDEAYRAETPIEVEASIEAAAEAIDAAIAQLESVRQEAHHESALPPAGRPTRQQGQFLAFIAEYMKRNYAGVAPRHADFQRFFNLTPPSVNSMLIRLEQRGFIRRVPGKARAIELAINPKEIPLLERPFKF